MSAAGPAAAANISGSVGVGGSRRWLPAALLAAAIVFPLVAPNDYWTGVATRIALYSTLALGLNVVVGFAGLLDLGYVAFFGIGSYIYAFLASPHFGLHWPTLAVLPVVLVGTAIAQFPPIFQKGLVAFVYYVVVGIGWILPAMPLIRWMSRP